MRKYMNKKFKILFSVDLNYVFGREEIEKFYQEVKDMKIFEEFYVYLYKYSRALQVSEEELMYYFNYTFDRYDRNLYFYMCMNKHLNLFSMFNKYIDQLTVYDIDNKTMLYYALENRNLSAVKRLVKYRQYVKVHKFCNLSDMLTQIFNVNVKKEM